MRKEQDFQYNLTFPNQIGHQAKEGVQWGDGWPLEHLPIHLIEII